MSFNASSVARALLRQARPQRVLASSAPRLFAPRLQVQRPLASTLRGKHSIPRPQAHSESVSPSSAAETNDSASAEPTAPWEDADVPKSEGPRPEVQNAAYYQLSFTCRPCGHRSHHNISKQGYHYGSTLITCPNCRNRHVISDHLNIFGDRKITVEDLMRERGQLVKRGTLGEDGNIEFWPDDYSSQESNESGTSGRS